MQTKNWSLPALDAVPRMNMGAFTGLDQTSNAQAPGTWTHADGTQRDSALVKGSCELF